ncbi:MAG: ribonuclease P protein subunit [Nanoarchaeales archaeon]|nr:ribonuclease P protein subunit [Nanoarchaeales archaeon]
MSKNRNKKKNSNSNIKLSTKRQIEVDLTLKSLIGKTFKIIKSTMQNQIGIVGELVHETANFFVLSQNGSTIRILKRNVTIELEYKGQALYMDGRFLYSTLTQRIKKFK